MLDRLEAIAREHRELEEEMADPNVFQDGKRYQEISQRYAKLGPIVKQYRALKRIKIEISEAQELLAEETDEEMRRFLEGEIETNRKLEDQLISEIRTLLLPEDPDDEKNAIVEIRAGAGGGESALFAADLFRMYGKYAEQKGWNVDLMDSHPTSIGGFKEIIFAVEGKAPYGRLKFESGVHRVQRVPETESSGRIHTSTATVAVLPEAEEVEVAIDPDDLEIETFRSSGPGGQHANVTDSAVRVIHKPTGMTVTCQDERSQHKNRAKAMRILRSRLKERLETEKRKERDTKRRLQIGSAARSEKIRTYNFPQNRVTDHRINLTLHQLEEILAGNLDPILDALTDTHRQELLESLVRDL
ncbi:MAG: peptide chain release factor 1 [Candidatus Bipolaricaulia bacterium]